MIATSVKYRGHRCFKRNWAGLETLKPINVLIGRNNTGKSHLIDFAEALCAETPYKKGWECLCEGVLEEADLKKQFQMNTSHGDLPGNHWETHGRLFVSSKVSWTTGNTGQVSDISLPPSLTDNLPNQEMVAARKERIKRILQTAKHSLSGHHFRRLLADRDIQPEPESKTLLLSNKGAGATNIIRRYMVSSSSALNRELIQDELLSALNQIFLGDGHFTEIEVKIHDDQETEFIEGNWEVFLGEGKKGLVPLSRSGSGLKTVILVLLNLLVIPHLENRPKHNYAFAFEELENNLHPALLRRLFQFLEEYTRKEHSTIFLTTHSSVALDIFGMSKKAQIIHVTHDGEAARAEPVAAHFDHLGVISELGAKPSDLLQANGIIWVEGPSDCIYLNRWIDLFSGGTLQEGRDYQCAFYGGSLLARTQFASPEDAEAELVNLFRVNPNIIVICDNDRTAKSGEGSRIKDRVRRISSEVQKIPSAHIWVTGAKEIENYLPGQVLSKAFDVEAVPNPEQYQRFFPSEDLTKKTLSFAETHLKRRTIDKMNLAVQTAPHMTKEMLLQRFDLASEIETIIKAIRRWNSK